MNLKRLMDKDKALQLSILEEIFHNKLPLSTKIIQDKLKISNFVLCKHLNEINSTLNALSIDAKINVVDKHISLDKNNTGELYRIYSYYIENSLNYQILNIIFPSGKYNIDNLSMLTYASPATLYRNITDINLVLKDVGLKLENGSLIGEELDICSFYYQLFWQARHTKALQKELNTFNNENILLSIEKIIGMKISSLERLRLSLWIEILKRRGANKKTIITIDNNILNEISKNDFFNKIKDDYYIFIGLYSSSGSEYKAVFLYIFIISTFTLAKPITDSEIKRFEDLVIPLPKVKKMNKYILSYLIKKLNINPNKIDNDTIFQWFYIFTQVHNQLLFFSGQTLYYELYTHLENENNYGCTNLVFLAEDIINKVESILELKLSDSAHSKLSKIYITVLYEAYSNYVDTINIGVISSNGYLASSLLFYNFKNGFKLNSNFNIEIAVSNTHYNLLISDSSFSLENLTFDDVYIAYDINSNYDKIQIKNILKNLVESRYV